MNPFDRDLHEALRRQEPPLGFSGKVLARARELDARPKRSFAWRWTAAAAAVVVLVSGSLIYRDHLRQLEGEKAKEQVMLALRLTGSKLQEIKTQLEK